MMLVNATTKKRAKINCPFENINHLFYTLELLTTKVYQMMDHHINAVKKFHKAFNVGLEENPTVALSDEVKMLRYKLMKEENEEYLEAAQNNDIVEVADALGDMLYILCGTIISHGMQDKIVEVFDEIQRSNMSKLGEDGNPIYREDGKVLKGPNYFRPNIQKILDK